jgi:hypothetical protein
MALPAITGVIIFSRQSSKDITNAQHRAKTPKEEMTLSHSFKSSIAF